MVEVVVAPPHNLLVKARCPETRERSRSRPAVLAALGSLILAGCKFLVWLATGSVAMLASAVDSAGDTLVSLGNALALRAASQPADREHPFGHGGIEDLAALLQSLIIAGSGVFVVTAALDRFQGRDGELHNAPLGITAALLSLVAAWCLSTYLTRSGERLGSPALLADSEHYRSDYMVQVAVVVGFASKEFFDQPLIDPAVSLGIAFIIFKTAWERFGSAAQSIMDREVEAQHLQTIDRILKDFHPRVHGYHDLLTRRSGPDRFIQLHMDMDADLTFREAHDLAEEAMRILEEAIPRAQVTIHADPWPPAPDSPERQLPHARRRTFHPPGD